MRIASAADDDADNDDAADGGKSGGKGGGKSGGTTCAKRHASPLRQPRAVGKKRQHATAVAEAEAEVDAAAKLDASM